MDQDLNHIKILSVFHYVLGGLVGLFGCMPFLHLFMGILFIAGSMNSDTNGDAAPAFVGWIFIIIPCIIISLFWGLAGCIIAAGCCLGKQKKYMYCLVMAGIECLFMPFGTVLGVFTIIVLMRESVKEMFKVNEVIESTG